MCGIRIAMHVGVCEVMLVRYLFQCSTLRVPTIFTVYIYAHIAAHPRVYMYDGISNMTYIMEKVATR